MRFRVLGWGCLRGVCVCVSPSFFRRHFDGWGWCALSSSALLQQQVFTSIFFLSLQIGAFIVLLQVYAFAMWPVLQWWLLHLSCSWLTPLQVVRAQLEVSWCGLCGCSPSTCSFLLLRDWLDLGVLAKPKSMGCEKNFKCFLASSLDTLAGMVSGRLEPPVALHTLALEGFGRHPASFYFDGGGALFPSFRAYCCILRGFFPFVASDNL